MDVSLPKIDSYEKYLEMVPNPMFSSCLTWKCNPTGHTFLPIIPGGTNHELVPGADVFPDVPWASYEVNEHNFWLNREAGRFNNLTYSPPAFINSLRGPVTGPVSKIWWHFLHISLNDPSMIAFTPSWEYGMRDRQVTMKVGKYLTKFYGEVMSAELIRDIVNRCSDREILWAKTEEEIVKVYEDGPNSCMSGCVDDFEDGKDFNGVHPAAVYGYIHEDGQPEFNVAYLESAAGMIVARALIAAKAKVFVRCYGDDGPILQSHLTAAGYELVSDMGAYELRLKKFTTDGGRIIMPYLDGDSRGIKNYGGHWQWTNGNYDHYANNSEGRLGYGEDEDEDQDDFIRCGHCENYFESGDVRYSEHHDMSICESCRDDQYVEAYFSRSQATCLVEVDTTILCETDQDYYLNEPRILEWHDIVLTNDNLYYEVGDDNIFHTANGDYIHIDEIDDYIECANGPYAKRDDITNEWRGEKRHEWVWHHPDNMNDADLKIEFTDDFGTLHTRWEPNPKYVSPGQLWSMHQDDHNHPIHDLCGHIADLGEEWEEEATAPDVPATPVQMAMDFADAFPVLSAVDLYPYQKQMLAQMVRLHPALGTAPFPAPTTIGFAGNTFSTIIFDDVMKIADPRSAVLIIGA